MMIRLRKTVVLLSCALAFVSLFVALVPTIPLIEIPARAEFAKKVSITGGSPAPQLSSALSTAGYSGGATLDELTICIPTSNTNTLYVGSSSSVNATTGFPLEPGTCITYRSGARAIDASRIFCFETTTESIAVTLRER